MKRRTTRTTLYGAFEKIEAQEDGTLIVSGYASSEAVDSDGEIVKASAIADAIPDYMRFGAVREMHQASAAGTALEMQVEADGRTAFKAHVVDPVAVKKVETEVYKGFSIGGRVTERDSANRKVITGLSLTEVSLVDRPANPEAVFKLAKIDGAEASEPIQKGLWSVARLAELLQDVQFLAQDSAWEAESEGDSSSVPAQLREWLSQGVSVLTAMVSEEGSEAVENVPAADPAPDAVELADVVAAADTSTDVEKVETPAAVSEDERIATIVAKVLSATQGDALAKRIDELLGEQLHAHKADLAKRDATVADLQTQLDALKAMPAPAKGRVNAAGITKAQDSANRTSEPDPIDRSSPMAVTIDALRNPIALIPGLSVRTA